MNESIITHKKWAWWRAGECVVEVLKRGHFPNTVLAKLPNDKITEIELVELDVSER